MTLKLISPAFEHGGRIPDEHVRDGHNISPPLEWTGTPKGARSFALAVENPDAPRGSFWHWAARKSALAEAELVGTSQA